MLLVEVPKLGWNVGKVPEDDAFTEAEALRIIDAFGNHPSFTMLSLGNELKPTEVAIPVMQRIVKACKERDSRHLYASSTGSFEDVFHENARARAKDETNKVRPILDNFCVAHVRGINNAGTDWDFAKRDSEFTVPVISHELGQWSVYPILSDAELAKYSGVMLPHNLEYIRSDLEKRGLLGLAPEFTMASGRLAALLYKEEMEALLRTPGHGGFLLLQLNDYPGQGTAHVGMLDVFWDSKGILTPEQYRRFCSPTVLLARLPQRSYRTSDTFSVNVDIAHFGSSDIAGATAVWELKSEDGLLIGAGEIAADRVPTGDVTRLGHLEASLKSVAAPQQLTLTVRLKGTDAVNDWNVWVYPAELTPQAPQNLLISHQWDEPTRSALLAGKNVFLLVDKNSLSKWRQSGFEDCFWSPTWFQGRRETMGLLCDTNHAALKKFPTQMNADWQWFDLAKAPAIVLDDAPAEFKPIVRVIDGFRLNQPMAYLLEAKVGKGNLMLCTLDLEQDLNQRIEARQMLASLYSYLGSPEFAPKQSLKPEVIDGLFLPAKAFIRSDAPPSEIGRAALHVSAADDNDPQHKNETQITFRQKDFSFSIRRAKVAELHGQTVWTMALRDLDISVNCPRGFEGRLALRLVDSDQKGRPTSLILQGRALGTISSYEKSAWIEIPVTSKETSDGQVRLLINTMGQDNAVAEFAVYE